MPSSASASPSASRCSGRRAASICCCRYARGPSTIPCALSSNVGIPAWPTTTWSGPMRRRPDRPTDPDAFSNAAWSDSTERPMKPEMAGAAVPVVAHSSIGRFMPYFTAAHVSRALGYLPGRTHPSLVSFLGMLKAEVPISATPSKAFGRPGLRPYPWPESSILNPGKATWGPHNAYEILDISENDLKSVKMAARNYAESRPAIKVCNAGRRIYKRWWRIGSWLKGSARCRTAGD